MTQLAIFDLDHTLIDGDSDYLWGQFLCRRGHVDALAYEARNRAFYADYQAGSLDIDSFLRFSLAPLVDVPLTTLADWHQEFMATEIEPIILPKAEALIAWHRDQGHHPLIITATNAFVTTPIARRLGIDDLLATEPELIQGRYTGHYVGTPTFRHGKVHALEAWLADRDGAFEATWFYSDSRNDLPLLERVDHPVAVDADTVLDAEAERRGWRRISLR